MVVEDKIVDGFKVKVAAFGDLLIGAAYEIGPRILYLASSKRPDLNLFGILPDVRVQTSEGSWRIYGGHRLWSSPEAKPRSYSLDDKPVKVEFSNDTLTVYGNPEENNCIQKEIIIKANPSGGAQVIHRIRNIGRWPITLACWALSVMRKGGFAIIPIKPSKVDEEGLLPDRHISLWPYTDLTDKRLSFTNEYVFIKQDPNIEKPVKIGANTNPEWTAYYVNGMIFIKQFYKEAGEYPDFGCNVEVYTNSAMLELETLGPLKTINPSESIQHVEVWKVFETGETRMSAEDIRDKIEPLLK